jgi:hypothetical protein
MKGNAVASARSWVWLPVALLAAAGAAGLWLWLTHGASVPLRLGLGLLALTAAVALVWIYRARRAARRFWAALDAYAEKEMARAERRPRVPTALRRRTASRAGV